MALSMSVVPCAQAFRLSAPVNTVQVAAVMG